MTELRFKPTVFFVKTDVVPASLLWQHVERILILPTPRVTGEQYSPRANCHGSSWNQSVIFRETGWDGGGRGPKVSLCIRVVSVLTFHSFHKYCLSTHYMPGRECSSPLQPWIDNQFPGVGLAPDTRDCVPAKPHPREL